MSAPVTGRGTDRPGRLDRLGPDAPVSPGPAGSRRPRLVRGQWNVARSATRLGDLSRPGARPV